MAGTKIANLHIASNDSDENPFDITLTGTATPVPAPEIAVEQPSGTNLVDGSASVGFGSVLLDNSSQRAFVIRNTGNADLTGLGITIDGANAGEFSVTANPTAPVPGPTGITNFTVTFTPASAGAKTAVLHIASNDSDENPFDITLTGTGTPPPAPEIASSNHRGPT